MALLTDTIPAAKTIASFAELVQVLDRESQPAGHTDALLRLSITPLELDAFNPWNSRHYTRQCIHRTRAYELLLIGYEPGQRTSIHDYDSQRAWIMPLQGTVQEERFVQASEGGLSCHGRKLLHPGSISYMADKHRIHRHSNAGTDRAITLNLYARPILRWRVYDEHSGLASLARTTVADEG